MSPRLIDVSGTPGGGRSLRTLVIVIGIVLVILLGNPVRVIPAGHVGVKDFFGNVSSSVLMPGVRVVFPFTRVVNMSIKTQEVKETAEVPSKEGLTMDLEGSLLFRLDPSKAAEIYRTIGPNYQEIAVVPQGRGIITEAVLLRKIGLPAVVANAIQEKLKREQEAEQMKFVLQKEQQEAE